MTLDQLVAWSKTQNREAAVAALLNAGIITTAGGHAAFIHKTFEEFGYAWKVIAALRKGDSVGFSSKHYGPNEIEIAHTAITSGDVPQLVAWLSHVERTVRYRVARLLILDCDADARNVAFSRLSLEKSPGIQLLLVGILLKHRDLRLRDWLNANLELLVRRDRERIAHQIRAHAGEEHAESTLSLARKLPRSFGLGLAALTLCLDHNRQDKLSELLLLYQQASHSFRNGLALAVGQYLSQPIGFEFTTRMLNVEQAADLTVALLKMCRTRLIELPPATIERACAVLDSRGIKHQPPVTAIRKLARMLSSIPDPPEPLRKLLLVCQQRSAGGGAK